jgi:tyrosyl-tRNA synthetase
MIDIDKQLEVFRRGTVAIETEEELIKKLKEDRPLRIKLGVDPTAPDLHLGHTVPLRKLADLQKLGHEVQFLIGDFTAMIGDPTGRNKTRPPLTQEEVREHAQTYVDQVHKVLDPEKTTIHYNSEWFNKINLADFLKLTAQVTVARMLERDSFEKRLADQQPVHMHELMYCILTAYDSVALKSDVEIGATEQTFNMLMSRPYQQHFGQPQQVVMSLPMLVGTDGVQKMSKSLGNYIGINETSTDMYGKTMSVPDELIISYFTLVTPVPEEEIAEMEQQLKAGSPPMDIKMRLARTIVADYHGEAAATSAEKEFKLHQTRPCPECGSLNPFVNASCKKCDYKFADFLVPDDMPTIRLSTDDLTDGVIGLVDILDMAMFPDKKGQPLSRGHLRRMAKQGGVRVDGEAIKDERAQITPADGMVVSLGKRQFAKVVLD